MKGQLECYTKSTGVLRTMRHLNGLWPMLFGLLILPKFLRDFGYDVVASNRYKIFGKLSSCRIPDIKTKKKVLSVAPLFNSNLPKNSNVTIPVDTTAMKGLVHMRSEDMFNETIQSHQGLVVAYFFAKWCQPCKQVSPEIKTWAESEKFGNETKFIKIDADNMRPVAKRFKVKTLPQFLLFRNGGVVGRHVGSNITQLEASIRQHC
mmetsp:Transcript_5453/g.10036  ORF Transcript_5453/g.10036 Transcript_5453/m.10036 type:complete len:206 (+) Transcript_5453:78-695(+)